MAARLRKYSQTCLLSLNKQICNPVRLKYWKVGEDSMKEKGEKLSDRVIGVPKQNKRHPETPFKGQFELDPVKGRIYDKKPFPALLKAGKVYHWCTCGYSRHQPFCDGSHKRAFNLQHRKKHDEDISQSKPKFEPHKFEVNEDGEYWLCNCKQTNNRPFCDGTHKREHVQEGKSIII